VARIERLDHVIVAVGDRAQWIPVIYEVLGLTPGRKLEGSGHGAAAFSNAEFAIGDGFLGVVEPSGEASQLHRFLSRSGDGFYAMSIDVGDVAAATAAFEANGVDYRGQAGQGLVWAGPRRTHGVLYQVIDGMLLGAGTNARYLGLARVTVAVEDLDQALADYQAIFGFVDHEDLTEDPPGSRAARLALGGSALDQHLVLAQPTDPAGELAIHLAARGEGIFSFAIAVRDLAGELERLRTAGVGVLEDSRAPSLVTIDPGALRGLRVELIDAGPDAEQ
jgi:catechol 2,3-dioxygenase-like lactoylglutathione lyase family enzyme